MPRPSRPKALPPDVPAVVVVPPPPPAEELPQGVPLSGQKRARKHPVDPREYPAARDARAKPSRAEIRQEAARHVPSRQSNRPPERSGQPRKHRPKAAPKSR